MAPGNKSLNIVPKFYLTTLKHVYKVFVLLSSSSCMLVRRVFLSKIITMCTVLKNGLFLEQVLILLIQLLIWMIINIYLYRFPKPVNIKEDLVVLPHWLVIAKTRLNLYTPLILEPWVLSKYWGDDSLILDNLFSHSLNVIFHWLDHLFSLLYFFL